MQTDTRRKIVGVFVCLLLLGAAWWAGHIFMAQEAGLRAFLARIPFIGAAGCLVLVYVLSSFIIVDIKDILKVMAALLFGAWWSTLLIWIAELINNTLLFHLARRLGRGWVESRFRLQGKDVSWVERMCGVWQVFVLRTVPVVPYRILDIAYGLTAIRFRRYFTISAIASPFRIFWLQFILAGLGGAVFAPQKIMVYLQENPVVVCGSALYLAVSLVAAVAVSRKIRS